MIQIKIIFNLEGVLIEDRLDFVNNPTLDSSIRVIDKIASLIENSELVVEQCLRTGIFFRFLIYGKL